MPPGGPQLRPGLPPRTHHGAAEHAGGWRPAHSVALQRQTVLAQLSGRVDVSDDYLQSLSPEPVVRRRESLLNPQDSDERRACFARRLVLIEAFLHHDLGDGKTARAAVTSGIAADDACPKTPGTNPTPSTTMTTADRAARIRALKADRHVLRARPGPPPQYFGLNSLHLAANQAMYDSRVLAQECFGCTPDQMKAAPPGQPHWGCTHHGHNASAEERQVRVAGSGSGIMGGPRRRQA